MQDGEFAAALEDEKGPQHRNADRSDEAGANRFDEAQASEIERREPALVGSRARCHHEFLGQGAATQARSDGRCLAVWRQPGQIEIGRNKLSSRQRPHGGHRLRFREGWGKSAVDADNGELHVLGAFEVVRENRQLKLVTHGQLKIRRDLVVDQHAIGIFHQGFESCAAEHAGLAGHRGRVRLEVDGEHGLAISVDSRRNQSDRTDSRDVRAQRWQGKAGIARRDPQVGPNRGNGISVLGRPIGCGKTEDFRSEGDRQHSGDQRPSGVGRPPSEPAETGSCPGGQGPQAVGLGTTRKAHKQSAGQEQRRAQPESNRRQQHIERQHQSHALDRAALQPARQHVDYENDRPHRDGYEIEAGNPPGWRPAAVQ